MRKFSAVFAGMMFSLSASAETTAFGMILGESTEAQVFAQYSHTFTGINDFSGGPQYDLDPKAANFSGLTSLSVIFDRDGKLSYLMAKLSARRTPEVYNILADKYELIAEAKAKFPRRDRYSVFVNEGTEIVLNQPLMAPAELSYETAEMKAAFDAGMRRAEARKDKRSQAEEEML